MDSSSSPVSVENLTPQDILLGRGRKVDCWPGNVRFRELVAERSLVYYVCDSVNQRDAMARELISIVREDGTGRFLRVVLGGQGSNDGYQGAKWREITFTETLRKVKQALRDAGAKAHIAASGKRPVGTTRQSPKKPKKVRTALEIRREPTASLEPIPFEQLGSLPHPPDFGVLLPGVPTATADVETSKCWQQFGSDHGNTCCYQGSPAIDDSSACRNGPIQRSWGDNSAIPTSISMLSPPALLAASSQGQKSGQQHSLLPRSPLFVPLDTSPLPEAMTEQLTTLSLGIGRLNSMGSPLVQHFSDLGVLVLWLPQFSHDQSTVLRGGSVSTTCPSSLSQGACELMAKHPCCIARSCCEAGDETSSCRLSGEDIDSDALPFDDLNPLPLYEHNAPGF